jgi:hypothetical protein
MNSHSSQGWERVLAGLCSVLGALCPCKGHGALGHVSPWGGSVRGEWWHGQSIQAGVSLSYRDLALEGVWLACQWAHGHLWSWKGGGTLSGVT